MIARLATTDFEAPHLEYGTLSPLFVVFGAALLGVLVEALLDRRRRYAVQSVLALAGLAAGLAATVYVATQLTDRADGAAHGSVVA